MLYITLLSYSNSVLFLSLANKGIIFLMQIAEIMMKDIVNNMIMTTISWVVDLDINCLEVMISEGIWIDGDIKRYLSSLSEVASFFVWRVTSQTMVRNNACYPSIIENSNFFYNPNINSVSNVPFFSPLTIFSIFKTFEGFNSPHWAANCKSSLWAETYKV